MSCIFKNDDDGKQRAVLEFKREELLYDIKNRAFINGNIIQDDKHLQHWMQDIGEEGNIDVITRVLSRCHAKCKEMLFPYTKKDIKHGEIDNLLKNHDIYLIVLSLPEDFSQTTLDLLSKCIHDYMVYQAIYEWANMINWPNAEVWAIKANEAMEDAKDSLRHRLKIMRRKQHLF